VKKREIKELVIDRARWGTGQLRNEDGSMCCLGFLGKACGIKVKDMLAVGMPDDLPSWLIELFPDGLNSRDEIAAEQAANINDDPNMPRKKKEAKLRELFKTQGIKLTFVGRTPRPAIKPGRASV
jgi:hypothetical protein